MLRFGTTSFNDMYMHMDMEAEAVRDSGMRALLGHGVVDFDESCADLAPNIALIEKWNHAADDRIRVSLAPHSEGATTEKLLLKVREAAETYHVPIHIHVSETKLDFDGSLQRRGLTPPQYLEKLGLMEHSMLAAHCVWVTDEDIELLARRGVTVLHNPISNLKLASGIAPVGLPYHAGYRRRRHQQQPEPVGRNQADAHAAKGQYAGPHGGISRADHRGGDQCGREGHGI